MILDNNEKEYILTLSYGKDSVACLEAIKRLNLPLNRIVTVEVWATADIPADLPPMIEFKSKADKIIKERYGIIVEHISSKESYEDYFYKPRGEKSRYCGDIYGFPLRKGAWCNDRLKTNVMNRIANSSSIRYLGIAADETERIKRHKNKKNVELPLVHIGWTEADCYNWCKENNLLSPIYTDSMRGGVLVLSQSAHRSIEAVA